MQDLKTDLLIVGAGPAGASLACFLAEYGLTGLMIAAAPGTADTPRAHITNMAALECLRDIGLDKACLAAATTNKNMAHTRWCKSMAGEEYGRIYSWGHDPDKAGAYAAASGCEHVDLPQTLLEPILLERALSRGWECRFNTTLVSFEETDDGIVSDIRDEEGRPYRITTKYLFGCDGARSQVVRQLGIPLIKKPGGGLAINVYVEVDMSHLVETRVGNLHWMMQPDSEHPPWARMALVRMVEPWTKWMFIIFPDPKESYTEAPSDEQYIERVKDLIGDRSLPVRLIGISNWNINEIAAERYSHGNIYCLGDAVHRHPPFNGLGSNTCIQDAYNLAWKVAYTLRGHASSKLLSTYSVERQPVGLGVVTRANQSFRNHVAVWTALGMEEPTLDARRRAFGELSVVGPEGRKRREQLRIAIKGTETEFHAIGREMGQRYDEYGSKAVVLDDEGAPRPSTPYNEDMEYQISTYPGSRLPHAWINTKVPQQQISTNDLAGHGCFTVLTGPGGGGWKSAAKEVGEKLGFVINAYSIGWGEDYEDVYGHWVQHSGVEEDGCILVRPDRFVGWRSATLLKDPADRLEQALKKILGMD
ncbi:putative FAD binding domain-containing protein [Seiridium cardinale]|uniref:FAD binding domain-containing protein n=1 Tax=Seiridium cardinale TaxID=138064 RepID=A0ABR2XRJ4_9PEZI